MKIEEKNNVLKNFEGGITLIALVVTIVVLLILAGVSISMLSGQNGIINRGAEAKEKTEKSEEKEGITLAVMSSKMKNVNSSMITKQDLENAMKEQFGKNKDFSIADNGDGSFLVNINDTKRMYYINNSAEIIDNDNILKISNTNELKAFRDEVNSGNTYEGKYILLTNDITLNINEEWKPIGYYSQDTVSLKEVLQNPQNKPFSGIFDGRGYTIDNVYINTENNVQGIFGLVIGGTIQNINLGKNSVLSMRGSASGGIIGYMYGTGKVYNCNNYADMDKTRGGIVGVIAGSITVSNSRNYGNLNNAMGGIAGSSNGTDWKQFINSYNNIVNCGNYGKISGKQGSQYIGGIVGYFKGTIANSFNIATILITSGGNKIGGIAGNIDGNILNCYNVGDISGYYDVGGIAGILSEDTIGIFENCYNSGNVQGSTTFGELVGSNKSKTKLQNSYISLDNFSADDLGSDYKEDTNNINNGYPILNWQ